MIPSSYKCFFDILEHIVFICHDAQYLCETIYKVGKCMMLSVLKSVYSSPLIS